VCVCCASTLTLRRRWHRHFDRLFRSLSVCVRGERCVGFIFVEHCIRQHCHNHTLLTHTLTHTQTHTDTHTHTHTQHCHNHTLLLTYHTHTHRQTHTHTHTNPNGWNRSGMRLGNIPIRHHTIVLIILHILQHLRNVCVCLRFGGTLSVHMTIQPRPVVYLIPLLSLWHGKPHIARKCLCVCVCV